ncbi:hypothetical protein MNEG_8978 [Monoraphidium neglectum]|uniref:Protein kinase domain-containing protein n=1 Tax=Monoraphidium neglectum TaxID=145388 RepID=A0A0D2KU68_9CHLO|nr:hypothetical protein MNEG_8978 [Monoraphidium neglectum]KIY98983.1 hypothetical protein MNEG_8978 [Monoraphidium neglectum]|eukprot:XP_013898003.1 hypothetical protein MNEG_8978 [Monoraphidium neglectum]
MALPNFPQLFSRGDPVLASLPGSQLRAMRSVYQEGSSLVGLVRLPDGRPAVVKALCKDRLIAQPALVDQVLSEILSQEELGPEVLYPGGVPALLAVHEDETHVHLVFEYGGEALMPMIGGLTWQERDALTDEIARTLLPLLAGLHAKGFSYNDLKPEQLLINRCLDGTLAPRLCDFGGVTALGCGAVLAFTPRYAPPEAAGEILKFVYDRGAPSYLGDLVGPEYDAWALAASVAVVQAGRHPWETAEAAAALARGDGDAHDAAMARRIRDAPRAHRDLPDILALRPAKLAFLDSALDPHPAARPSPLELCFGEYGESLGITDCLDWVPAVGEAVPLLADLAERRRARGDEARAAAAAAAAAHAAEVAALCAAAGAEREAAARREGALHGRVAALEDAARAGAVREVRKDEAAAAAASAHAAESAALRAAASAARDEAAQREGALQGRVAALESQAQRKDEAAAALRAALADEQAAFQAQVAALQARLAELEGASRAAVVAAAALAGEGSRGGGECGGTSCASSVCSGDDGSVEHALSAELLASRAASPRLSLDGVPDAGAEQAKEQQQVQLEAASHAASGCGVSDFAARAEVPIKVVVDGCGEPRAPSRASSRSVSPSGPGKLRCAGVAAFFAAEHGGGSCSGAGIAAPTAGAMKPCAVARAAATCSTDDVSCSSAHGDACAAPDAASGREADAAAVIAVVTLTSTSNGARGKEFFFTSGGVKRPCAVRGGRDVRTPAERVHGAAHKLRKEAGKATAALKGLLCMRAPAAY